MPFFDLPLDQLSEYKPTVLENDDFDDFWTATVSDARRAAYPVEHVVLDSALARVIVEDVTFSGFDGQPVKAWYLRPAGVEGPLPGVVKYLGYGGGRGLPVEELVWVSAGYAVLVMDTRGQGGAWGAGGQTADDAPIGPSAPGFMTRGIQSPETY